MERVCETLEVHNLVGVRGDALQHLLVRAARERHIVYSETVGLDDRGYRSHLRPRRCLHLPLLAAVDVIEREIGQITPGDKFAAAVTLIEEIAQECPP